jgi:hypothetical protein
MNIHIDSDIALEQEYKDFMVKCWEREKEKRPSLDQIRVILNNLLVCYSFSFPFCSFQY